MKKRTIHVKPGDLVEIRVINDPDAERTAAAWHDQLYTPSMLIEVKDSNTLAAADPQIRMEYPFSRGDPG